MNFLDEDVFNNNVYLREFGNLFVEFSICVSKGDRSFKNLISYEDFSLLIKKMVEDLINSYAIKLNYSKKFSLFYKTMEGINLGGVSFKTNNIFIDYKVLNDIYYRGEYHKLLIIFHEVSHVITKINVDKCVINEETIRVFKEDVISNYFKNVYGVNKYYLNNYIVYTDEVLADKYSVLYLESIIYYSAYKRVSDKKMLDDFMKGFHSLFLMFYNNNIEERYNTLERNVKDIGVFNTNILSYEEIFLYVLNQNKYLIDSPFVSGEYVLKDNKILKREVGGNYGIRKK